MAVDLEPGQPRKQHQQNQEGHLAYGVKAPRDVRRVHIVARPVRTQ